MANCFYCESPMYKPGRDRAGKFIGRTNLVTKKAQQQFLNLSRDTKEHLKRRADGGVGLIGNTVRACNWCNTVRGEATVEEHKAAMMALVKSGKHPVASAYRVEQQLNGEK